MAPKGDSFKKNTNKKPAPKSDNKLVNEDTKISSSNSDLVEYPMKGQVGSRDKRSAREKKVVTPEDTPPRGPRWKNLSSSPPHSPSSSEDENNEDENITSKGEAREEKSSSYEIDSENTSEEEVYMTQ